MASTNHESLTSSEKPDGFMSPPRIHRVLPEDERTVPNAAARLMSAAPASETQRCLNPSCQLLTLAPEEADVEEDEAGRRGTCSWPVKGRPSYFCRRECRDQYEYERGQLIEDIRALEESRKTPGGTYRERRKVEVELAKRNWAWQRYLFDPSHPAKPAEGPSTPADPMTQLSERN